MNLDELVSQEERIEHHGIKGQKWGVRRYQNEDGTLTSYGKKRYLKDSKKLASSYSKVRKRLDITNKRAQEATSYSHRARWLIDDETMANKSKRFDRAFQRYNKSLKKAEKLYRKMESKYSKQNMNDVDSATVRKGFDLYNQLAMSNAFLYSLGKEE